MKLRDIFNIGIKLIGIFFALSAFDYFMKSGFSSFFSFFAESFRDYPGDIKLMRILNIIQPIIFLIIAMFLILKSETLVRLLYQSDNDSIISLDNNFQKDSLTLFFQIFGVIISFRSLPHISYLLGRLYYFGENFRFYEAQVKVDLLSSIISGVLYLGFGLYMTFSAKKLSTFFSSKKND